MKTYRELCGEADVALGKAAEALREFRNRAEAADRATAALAQQLEDLRQHAAWQAQAIQHLRNQRRALRGVITKLKGTRV